MKWRSLGYWDNIVRAQFRKSLIIKDAVHNYFFGGRFSLAEGLNRRMAVESRRRQMQRQRRTVDTLIASQRG